VLYIIFIYQRWKKDYISKMETCIIFHSFSVIKQSMLNMTVFSLTFFWVIQYWY